MAGLAVEAGRDDGGRQGQPAEFVSASSAMDGIWRMVDRVAATDVPVLVRGESGVGKDVVARTLHARSPRAHKPFLKINCAALPATLLESELFGYQRGAFTGAVSDTKGKFELADEGTLFMDEIGEMPPEMQAKLLQVLQDGEYFRVGGTKPVRVDTRVVVATNRDLEAEIARGGFRSDLFYRLNVVSVRVPPLRERPEDVPILVDHFLRRYAARYESGVDVVPDDVLDGLVRYPWPGNVRELENLVKRMVVLGDVRGVAAEVIAARGATPPAAEEGARPSSVPAARAPVLSPVEALDQLGIVRLHDQDELELKDLAQRAQTAVEREVIAFMLRRSAWNKRQTARKLHISYKALLYKIKECGIVDPRLGGA
jgi:two-component system response regulator AtoC